MLTSINPLGERGRGHRWGVTMGWLFVGHLVGGLALGALMAGAGIVLHTATGGHPDDTWRAVVALVVAGAAAVFDLAGGRVPGRRQVDERWLTSYRGWVYGLGFGAQLGFGLVTVINSALLFAMVVAGVLAGPAAALVIGLAHGATRAVLALANGRVRSVDDLKALHRRLDGIERRVRSVFRSSCWAPPPRSPSEDSRDRLHHRPRRRRRHPAGLGGRARRARERDDPARSRRARRAGGHRADGAAPPGQLPVAGRAGRLRVRCRGDHGQRVDPDRGGRVRPGLGRHGAVRSRGTAS